MIRLAIVVAVRLYREGLIRVLADARDIEVVLTESDWRAAASDASDLKPDVILVDLPIGEARSALRGIASAVPMARLVALSVADEDGEIVWWAEAGVVGYVTRENSLAELVDVVRSVARGEMPCSPRTSASLLRHVASLAAERPLVPRLTSRERQIVRLIERGLTNKEIGAHLRIEVATVKNHVHNILEKLHVRTRYEAVIALRAGVLPELERLA